MNLTPLEIKYAERSVRRLERDARQWPRMRWIMLVGSILMLGISIYSTKQLVDLIDSLSTFYSIRRGNYEPKNIELFVTGQVMNLRVEIVSLLRIVLQTLAGGIGLVYSLRNWNRHLKSALMAKALQKLITEK